MFVVMDLTHRPPVMVASEEKRARAEEVAKTYANQTQRKVTVWDCSESSEHDPEPVPDWQTPNPAYPMPPPDPLVMPAGSLDEVAEKSKRKRKK